MELAARIGTMARRGAPLPYDAEVEYIQGSGAQYIDLNYVATDTSGCEVSFAYDQNVNQDGYVFGSRTATDRFSLNVTTNQNLYNNGFYYGFGGTSQVSAEPKRIDIIQGLSFTAQINFYNNRKCKCGIFEVDCNVIHNDIPKSFLFAENRYGVPTGFILGKIFGFKITEGESLVMNLVPVKFTNENGENEGAMYDRVSGQLFRNAGTGAFIIGPDKVSQLGGGV